MQTKKSKNKMMVIYTPSPCGAFPFDGFHKKYTLGVDLAKGEWPMWDHLNGKSFERELSIEDFKRYWLNIWGGDESNE